MHQELTFLLKRDRVINFLYRFISKKCACKTNNSSEHFLTYILHYSDRKNFIASQVHLSEPISKNAISCFTRFLFPSISRNRFMTLKEFFLVLTFFKRDFISALTGLQQRRWLCSKIKFATKVSALIFLPKLKRVAEEEEYKIG